MRDYVLVEYLFVDEVANTADLIYGVSESSTPNQEAEDSVFIFRYTIDNFNSHSDRDILMLMNYIIGTERLQQEMENYLDNTQNIE